MAMTIVYQGFLLLRLVDLEGLDFPVCEKSLSTKYYDELRVRHTSFGERRATRLNKLFTS